MGANSGIDFAEGFEGCMRGLDGGVDIFGAVIWCRSPDFAGSWVYWMSNTAVGEVE
jgi:hypothetical protein